MRTLCTVLLLVLLANPVSGRSEALLQAARDGKRQQAIELVKSGADVRQTGKQGETALHWAAFHGSQSLARLLIAKGAVVNARVDNGNTPLHHAAYNGHLDLVRLLLASGAKIDAANEQGFTATQWAHRNEHAAVLDFLVSRGGLASSGTAVNKGTAAPAKRVATREKLVLTWAAIARASVPKRKQPVVVAESPKPIVGPTKKRQKGRADSWTQLGSFSSRERAQRGWRTLRSAHAQATAGYEPLITEVRLAAKSKTVYRLRVGPLARADARLLCVELHKSKRPCLVIATHKNSTKKK